MSKRGRKPLLSKADARRVLKACREWPPIGDDVSGADFALLALTRMGVRMSERTARTYLLKLRGRKLR